jgi:hypothetical protein
MKKQSFNLAQIAILTITLFGYVLPSSAKEGCVRSQNGNTTCGELVEKNISSKVNKKTIRTKSGVNFTLEGCRKSDVGLVCLVSVFNSTDYDKRVRISPAYGSKIIDSEGNEYKLRKVDYGINGTNRGDQIITMPPKLTIKTQLLFIPSGRLTDYIRILQIEPDIEQKFIGKVIFRDFNVN